MERLGLDEDVPIEHGLVSKAIENAQVRVEGHNFDIRKHVLEYDNVVNKQREVIYIQRRQIMSEPSMRPTIMGMVEDELKTLATLFAGSAVREEWDLAGLAAELNKIIFPPHGEQPESWRSLTTPQLHEHLVALAVKAYDAKEAAMGAEMLRHLERLVMLRAVDNRWVRHLTDLDELREGIGLRAFGQQDPLVAYKREAHEMYEELVSTISHDVVYNIYHAQFMARPTMPQRMQTNRGDGGAPQPARSSKTPGRNDPCWCGSGKKYKQCHMRADQGRESAPAAGAAPAAAVPVPKDGAAPVRAAGSVPVKGGKPPAKVKAGRR
jgi:preprotein translocase subunit SecA